MDASDILKVFLTAFGTLAAAWIAGWWAKRGKELDNTAAPYEALANRVTKLENQVGILQSWVAVSSAIHTDVTNRWEWYRQQQFPPVFPPSPSTDSSKEKS